MTMLTCEFGAGVTQIVWSLIGDAMNHVINIARILCIVFTALLMTTWRRDLRKMHWLLRS